MKRLVVALRHPRDYSWWELRPFREHSQVLLMVGLVYIAFGTILITQKPTPDRVASLALALVVMPLWAWGIAWVLAGILGVLSSRWPPASETWGYTAMSAMAWCWCGLYGMGVALGVAPGSAVSGALIWLMVGFLWTRISKLVNPADVHDIVEERARILLDPNGTSDDGQA